MNGRQRGRRGFRISAMPASGGRRLPLRVLQGMQEQTIFSHVVVPPRSRGNTWSRFRSRRSNTRPQYWHVFRSRSKMLFRVNFTSLRGDHPRDADAERNRLHHLRLRIAVGKIAPALEIVREEIVPLVLPHDMCMALAEQGEGASDGTDVHRLPEAVQHKHLGVENMLHGSGFSPIAHGQDGRGPVSEVRRNYHGPWSHVNVPAT